jgi:glyoxylase-like metal-dependent hydrolase (beta-lactamase superfamily II)
MNIGSIRCHIVSDGQQKTDGGGFFGLVPKVLWQRVIEPNEINQVPSALRVLLIESDAGLILVDTGQGDKLTPKIRGNLGMDERSNRLVGDLGRLGFAPEDIDIVVLTHLHGDHAGGATRWDTPDGTEGPVVPTFPNARYMVQRLDLAEASFPNERTRATYLAENWQPLLDRGQLQVVDGNQRLATGVRSVVSPGHTAGIQVVWVEDGGESLVFLGDTCSWAVHMDRLAWVPSFDIYPMTSIETKRNLRAEALEKNAVLVFQHDPRIPAGRLAPGKRGPVVQPIITEEPWDDPTLED